MHSLRVDGWQTAPAVPDPQIRWLRRVTPWLGKAGPSHGKARAGPLRSGPVPAGPPACRPSCLGQISVVGGPATGTWQVLPLWLARHCP